MPRKGEVTEPASILVIRRDNIGDLVCTTPLIGALRSRYPKSCVGVLANSYNAPVLEGNPDIDEVHVYHKLKHLRHGDGALAALRKRVSMLWSLRRRNVDLVVIAAGPQDTRGERIARFIAPRRVVFSDSAVPGQHEVERAFTAARQTGFSGPIPAMRVVADPSGFVLARQQMTRATQDPNCRFVGLHISARRVSQRWRAERFAELAIAIDKIHGAATLLLWSPGEQDDVRHPGDDGKSAAIQALVGGKARLIPWRTTKLQTLIAGLAACDAVVCSDGGAMHIAAGLGKPVACFFGDSDVARWRPWGVPHIVLQAASGQVDDVGTGDALDATAKLLG